LLNVYKRIVSLNCIDKNKVKSETKVGFLGNHEVMFMILEKIIGSMYSAVGYDVIDIGLMWHQKFLLKGFEKQSDILE